jgi:hypothetical protein
MLTLRNPKVGDVLTLRNAEAGEKTAPLGNATLTLRNVKVRDTPLSAATQAFVDCYIRNCDGNATRAYGESHPACQSYDAIRSAASRLLRDPRVRALTNAVNVNECQGQRAAGDVQTPEGDEHTPTGARDVLGVDSTPALTQTSRLLRDGWHVSQLGWTRSVRPAENNDDGVGHALTMDSLGLTD